MHVGLVHNSKLKAVIQRTFDMQKPHGVKNYTKPACMLNLIR